MDRDELMVLLSDCDDHGLCVRVDGTLKDSNGDEYATEDVEEALKELEADIAGLRAVIAWARQAPKYQPVKGEVAA